MDSLPLKDGRTHLVAPLAISEDRIRSATIRPFRGLVSAIAVATFAARAARAESLLDI